MAIAPSANLPVSDINPQSDRHRSAGRNDEGDQAGWDHGTRIGRRPGFHPLQPENKLSISLFPQRSVLLFLSAGGLDEAASLLTGREGLNY